MNSLIKGIKLLYILFLIVFIDFFRRLVVFCERQCFLSLNFQHDREPWVYGLKFVAVLINGDNFGCEC